MKRIFLTLALSFVFTALSAQSASSLSISPDAAGLGMAGASMALDANAFALYNNPSAMSLTDGKGAAAVSYNMWQPSALKTNYFAASGYGKIKDKLAIGLSGRFVTHTPYDITSDQGVVTGSYTPREYAFGLGAAYKIWRFSLGATFNFLYSDLGAPKPGMAFSADVALMYKWKTLSIAASVANLGTKLNYGGTASYSLPEMFKLGLAYNIPFLEKHKVSFGLEGDVLFNGDFMIGGGLEYAFHEMGFLRCGYHYGAANSLIPSYLSLGLGVKVKGVTLNAAYLLADAKSAIKNSLSVSLGYEF